MWAVLTETADRSGCSSNAYEIERSCRLYCNSRQAERSRSEGGEFASGAMRKREDKDGKWQGRSCVRRLRWRAHQCRRRRRVDDADGWMMSKRKRDDG